uniref:RILP-like protein 2 n=1 Tax=Paramormyrops kingsleyae TaxID=1676925 RepID=A0A3B3R7B0_9TELE
LKRPGFCFCNCPSPSVTLLCRSFFLAATMQDVSDPVPAQAFEKDAFQLTVEDVYDISYVIGRDLLKITQPADVVSELQFKIVRVLEMFEALVNRYSLTVEELKMERDNLKTELDRILGNCANGQGTQLLGPDKLVVDLKDPNRPRFTMEELKEVLQERNQLKTQLLLAQEELQLYKRYELTLGHIFLYRTFIVVWINALYIDIGVLHQPEPSMADIDLEPKKAEASNAKIETKEGPKEEKTTIRKLFSFTKK